MKIKPVRLLKNQALIADKCTVAECFWDRLRGLIGKGELKPGDGMLLHPCKSIHMWFMKQDLDIVFIRQPESESNPWVVTSTHLSIRAWRLHPLTDWQATGTLELPVGTIQRCAIAVGDELCIG